MSRLFPLHPGYVMTVCADASNALAIQRSVDESMVVVMCGSSSTKSQKNGGLSLPLQTGRTRAFCAAENAFSTFGGLSDRSLVV